MKKIAPRRHFSVLLAAMLLVSAVPASALDGAADKVKDLEPQAAPAEKIAYKFTPSYYHTTNVTPAYDLNLRGNLGAQTTSARTSSSNCGWATRTRSSCRSAG